MNALWVRGLHLTLQIPSKLTPKQRRSQKSIQKNKNSEEKLSYSMWREFSLRGCRSSESKIRCPVDSKYCDRFHNCSCQRKHKAKTKKNNISITPSAFTTKKKKKKGAPRSHLRYATSAPRTSLFCDLWHPLPVQPMTASAPLTFCLWLSYWC